MFKAKYPAFLSTVLFQSSQKTLVGFSKRFKGKKQRAHFIHLVLSIINQGSTRLKEASQIITGEARSVVENLSRFLKNTAWSLELLGIIHASFLRAKLPKKLYVALDLTALTKTGKKFEYLDKVYDGRDNTIKDGFDLLMSLGINQVSEKDQYILTHKVVSSKHPEWMGENLEITQHIKELKSLYKKAKISLKDIIHIGDREFDRQLIIETFINENCLFVIRAKDKNVTLKDGVRTKLYQLPQGIYHQVYLETWKIYLNVIVVKAKEKEDDEKEEKMVLLTNLKVRKLSQKKAKEIYQMRWNIETCFKKLKNDYGLEDFRVRSFEAIQKIVSLTLLAFNLSQYYLRVWRKRLKGKIDRARFNIFSSIYYLRKYIQKMLNFGFQPDFYLNLALNQGNSS